MKVDNVEAFGKIVRDYRTRHNLTQSQLAAAADTGVRFIGDLEKGKPSVQLGKALKTAYMLGISLEVTDAGE